MTQGSTIMIRHEDHDSDYEGEDELEEHDGYLVDEASSPAASMRLITPTAAAFPTDIFSPSSKLAFQPYLPAETIDPSVFRTAWPSRFSHGSGSLSVVVQDELDSENGLNGCQQSKNHPEADGDDTSSTSSDNDTPRPPPRRLTAVRSVNRTESDRQPSVLISSDEKPATTTRVEEATDLRRNVAERVKRTRRISRRHSSFSHGAMEPQKESNLSDPDHESESQSSEVSSVRVVRRKKKPKHHPRPSRTAGNNRSEQNRCAQKKYRDKKREIAALNHQTLQVVFAKVLNDLPGMTKPAMLAALREDARRWIEDLRDLDPAVAAQLELEI